MFSIFTIGYFDWSMNPIRYESEINTNISTFVEFTPGYNFTLCFIRVLNSSLYSLYYIPYIHILISDI